MISMFQNMFENIQNWFSVIIDTIAMLIDYVISVFQQTIIIISRIPSVLVSIFSLFTVVPVPYVATLIFCVQCSVILFILGRTHDG